MYSVLASADSADSGLSNLIFILECAGILAITVAVAFALVIVARKRFHPHAEIILPLSFFWAIITAGSLLLSLSTQVKWRNEYNLQLQSGYLDPQNLAAKPSLPWILWIALAVAYVAILGWALALKRSPTK